MFRDAFGQRQINSGWKSTAIVLSLLQTSDFAMTNTNVDLARKVNIDQRLLINYIDHWPLGPRPVVYYLAIINICIAESTLCTDHTELDMQCFHCILEH